MAFKFVILAAFVAVAQAGNIYAPSPLAYAAAPAYAHAPLAYAAAPALAKTIVDTEYDPNPSYSYGYDVQDALTGDSKNQHESRQGDVVQGSYSLNEADGTRRIVDYTADPINGFNAVVRKEPLVAAAPLVAKTFAPAPLAYAAPIAKTFAPALSYASPALSYSAPITKTFAPALSYAAPIAKTFAPALSYAAPIAKTFAPSQYYAAAAPALSYAAAPIAKAVSYAATPIAHAAPLAYAAHTTFSTPYAAYAY